MGFCNPLLEKGCSREVKICYAQDAVGRMTSLLCTAQQCYFMQISTYTAALDSSLIYGGNLNLLRLSACVNLQIARLAATCATIVKLTAQAPFHALPTAETT